ncbi:hypothetical protein Hanom_Chr01g00089211 [Helianthus anomalus]
MPFSLFRCCSKVSVEMSSSTSSTFKDADLRRRSHNSTAFSLTCFSSASSRTAWICSKSSLRRKISPLNRRSRPTSSIAAEVNLRTISFTRAEITASPMINISKYILNQKYVCMPLNVVEELYV